MPHDSEPAKVLIATLKNGGSANLAVDGSVTPAVFTYSPPVDYDVALFGFSLLFEFANSVAFGNKFLSSTINTLANGLLLECKSNDLQFTWQNMRRTRDVVEVSADFDIVSGTTNMMRFKVALPHELLLVKTGAFASPDYLTLTVRDNLTGLTFAEAYLQGSKL